MATYAMQVTVATQFLSEQSDADMGKFVFAYTISITNAGSVAAQVISRHWVITDAHDQVEEVRGLGVIGHQPFLQPGQSFEYSSGSMLKTAQGTMKGEYFCVAEDGTRFEVEIPEFVLSIPRTLH